MAELEARSDWCSRRNLAWSLCVKLPTDAHQKKARAKWCTDNVDNQSASSCDAHFISLEEAFQKEWRERRVAYLTALKKPDLTGRNLRGAALYRAFLPGADLSSARLEGAFLVEAQLEGANLYGAQLQGAMLVDAWLGGVDLLFASLEGADLWRAQLERADLERAELAGANLKEARLEGANLKWAGLEGANLYGAHLQGASLQRARLKGANLREAQFQLANLRGSTIGASPLNSVDFTGAIGLSQKMLDEAIGDANTVLPLVNGKHLYVWSCWIEPPDNFEELIEMQLPHRREAIRAQWLCGPEGRKKTGRTAEVDGDGP